MKHTVPFLLLIVSACLDCTPTSPVALRAADGAPGGDDWRYDVVHRKKGDPYRGLVEALDGGDVRMWCIVRNPGRPTIFYRITLPRAEVDRVEMLPDLEHEILRRRFLGLREEHRQLPDPLKALASEKSVVPGADKIKLHEMVWRGDGKSKALAYRSTYFELESNAPRRVVTVAAMQLEQVYAAYFRSLPPRAKGRPTRVLLPQSLDDYRQLARGQGVTFLNPAFFDPAKNQIVSAFDWRQMSEEIERIHRDHVKLRAKVDECEADLRKAYKGEIPTELKAALSEQRRSIQAADARNRETFARAHHRLFQRLFHEAFHAYLLNFVYPSRDGELPRWLNEGLAQIFETAVFEVGELRIGHADKERLQAVRQALGKENWPSLVDLLRSGPKQFQVAHDRDKQISDRYYLASWGLAFYLTFDRKLLGTPALDDYVRQLKRGTDPVEAFAALTGQSVATFEADFRRYLNHLHDDGRVGSGK